MTVKEELGRGRGQVDVVTDRRQVGTDCGGGAAARRHETAEPCARQAHQTAPRHLVHARAPATAATHFRNCTALSLARAFLSPRHL